MPLNARTSRTGPMYDIPPSPALPYTSLLSTSADAFAYSEPSIIHLLVLLSFIYLLNVVRVGADYFLHAGIVASIAMGMIYGTPLAAIIPEEWESMFTVIGYLGLMGIVFEGGLSTNISLLFSNLPLSSLCAMTGVALPIAFSFAMLTAGYGYTPLEAFAAGAALSSTSLGTTLMALSSVSRSVTGSSQVASRDDGAAKPIHNHYSEASPKPLQQTRIGTVLISAAVIDDVIGLVLAAMIPALSAINDEDSHTNLVWTIVRPLLVSLLLTIITPLVSKYVLRPIFWYRGFGERWCAPHRPGKPWGVKWLFGLSSLNHKAGWGTISHADAVKVFLMVSFISAFASIAHYVGSSILYGAYLAGCVLPYIARPSPPSEDAQSQNASSSNSRAMEAGNTHEEQEKMKQREEDLSFQETFDRTIGPIQQYVFAPLFFASIGYAIPFIALWRPVIFWKGILYSLMMAIGKLAVGVPIVLWTLFSKPVEAGDTSSKDKPTWREKFSNIDITRVFPKGKESATVNDAASNDIEMRPAGPSSSPDSIRTVRRDSYSIRTRTAERPPLSAKFKASLAPAFFMGSAMVARGEIGLLIAQIARNGESGDTANGILREEAFLVCIWAILLCTLLGPVSVGFVVRWWRPAVSRGIWQ
ncbi:Sodium/hydrogen exchanger [Panus rudis PR-1116 ss-1]|nr:Sodium/hydrogen exchanger [Panus rudis PR-1116 ss-1]